MYYEVYIDVMFLVNFMMGRPYPVFCKSLDEDGRQYEKSVAGGLVGSGLSCLVVILRLPVGITMAVLHMLVSSGMVVCGLKIRSFSEFLKCYILLYFVSVLIGRDSGNVKTLCEIHKSLFCCCDWLLLHNPRDLGVFVPASEGGTQDLPDHLVSGRKLL